MTDRGSLMLDAESIRQPLAEIPGSRLELLEVFSEIGSTNDYLLDQPRPSAGRFRVALADYQTAGRGRLDRVWESPRSTGLCMSIATTFRRSAARLSGLTPALGIGVADALERLGVDGIGLKWPNDIIARDGKLGGILTEARSNSDGTTVVAGIGLNVDLRGAEDLEIEPTSVGRIVDLKACMGDVPSRETLAVTIIEQLFKTMARFDSHGFAPFVHSWLRYDWLRGQTVTVDTGQDIVTGRVEGIDAEGALFVYTDAGRRSILTGSVITSGQSGAT